MKMRSYFKMIMKKLQNYRENNPNDINKARVDEVKGKLEMLYNKKTEGILIIIRAIARWHEHGEKSSKYMMMIEG